MRELAHGSPLTAEQVDRFIANLGIAPDAAHQFMRQLTERVRLAEAQARVAGWVVQRLAWGPARVPISLVTMWQSCYRDAPWEPKSVSMMKQVWQCL